MSMPHDQMRDLFDEALSLGPDERTAFLDQRCGDDAALREEVESLLCAHDDPSNFLISAAPDDAATIGPGRADAYVGKTIAGYRIEALLGAGGMGAVYRAQQQYPARTVALKIIRPGMLGRGVLRRFDHEARILGTLQHPGIAQIYEAGTFDEGEGRQPFFAMEYVEGRTLMRFLDAHTLSLAERLELFARICDAVHHAHQKGIVHRDLKPDNILVQGGADGSVTQGDGTGSFAPQPKIVDFGVARAIGVEDILTTLHTSAGALIGTLPYMGPEQIAGDPAAVDTRSDVYSLGVILYQMLSGRLPHDLKGKSIPEAARVIAETNPTPLSVVARTFRGDLDTIVSKALEKEQSQRYGSASELADDVRRFLRDEPIRARPPSTFYQLRKFARRNRALVGSAAASFVVLVAALMVVSTALVRALNAERLAAQRAEQLEQVADFQASMLHDIDYRAAGLELLDDLRNEIRTTLLGLGHDEDVVSLRIRSFDEMVGPMNPTALATAVLDRRILARAVDALEEDFLDQPLVRARLLRSIAMMYRDMGRYRQAEPLAEESLALRRAMLGDDHPQTIEALGELGLLYLVMGREAEAESIVTQALELAEGGTGVAPALSIRLLLTLAGSYAERELLTEAERIASLALPHAESTFGPDDMTTLSLMQMRASVLAGTGRLAEAEELIRELLARGERIYGPTHLNAIMLRHNLATVLLRQGRAEEAEPLFLDTIEASRVRFGDEHHHTLSSMLQYASLLQRLERFDESEQLHLEALEVSRRVLGEDHRETLRAMNNLGHLYLALDKRDEAEALFREAYEASCRVLGEDDPASLAALINLSRVALLSGRTDESLELASEAARRAAARLGPTHRMSLDFRLTFGTTLVEAGRYSEARDEIAAVEQETRSAGPDLEAAYRERVARAYRDLYDAWHDADPAAGHDHRAAHWNAQLEEPQTMNGG